MADGKVKSIEKSETQSASFGFGRARNSVASSVGPAVPREQLAGNLAVQRLLRAGVVRPNLIVGHPADPVENEADRLASAFVARSPKRENSPAGAIERTNGPLSLGVRHDYERFFGADLRGVRVHTDTTASDTAAGIGARAFTTGDSIYFGRNQFNPTSSNGRKLLAHELAHVVRRHSHGPISRADHGPGSFHDPNRDIVSDVPGAIPGDAMDPTSGIDVDETVTIAAPLLTLGRRSRDDQDQTYHLHSAIISRIPISVYAIPRSRLTLDAAGAQPAASTTGTPPPVTAGSQVYGPNHLPLAVLGSDAANIFVESSVTIHYAVGAGSCMLVRTNSGWYMFDAGINLTEPHALAEAVVAKIASRVGGESIRAIFVTHAHYDHTSLLGRLARLVQIDNIVANPRQLIREEYIRIRESIRAGDLERRRVAREQIESDPHAREAFIDSLRRSGRAEAVNPQDVQRLWNEEVARQVDARYPQMREMAALPVRGTGGQQFETLGTRPLHGGEPDINARVEEILPSQEEVRGVVDPDLHSRRHQPLAEHEVDRMSNTYILTVNGRRLIVMPDLRRTDINRIGNELREALGSRNVEFQEWVLGHHTQIGFMEGPVSARTLRQTLELLHDFRSRSVQGRPGRDAVIASVDPAQVDPAQIRLLRMLGFETYLAQSQADVHTYEVLSGGRLVRGVRAPLAPGSTGEATLQRSIAGRRALEANRADLILRRNETRGPGSRATRAGINEQIRDLNTRIGRLHNLENALVTAARADPHNEVVTRQAEVNLNTALDAENVGRVVTSSSQLTDTALVLIREPLGPEPPPGTPEAEQRARDLALREQKSRVDLMRERVNDVAPGERQNAYAELYVELVEYEHRLVDVSSRHEPGITRDFAAVELERIRADRVALEHSFQTRTQAARLPDGQLVENRVVRIIPPEGTGARAPSRTARVMMQGLDYVGRGMGAVMVISTIRGTVDLIDRYEHGQANLAQLGIGGAREITSGIVALRMLRGARVSPGVFVLISALEIGEAVAGDYDSESARRRAVDTAVRNAAVNTGCMVVGELLMATMNPIGIAAGAIVMFLGPILIGLLFDDTPEELYPEEVGEVDELLRNLIREYEIVTGGLRIQRRSPAERTAIGLTEDIRLQAETSVLEHRMRALYLESEILPAFEAAYARTREGRAGLREIDAMRQRFLAMRAEASTDESDEEARREINMGMYGGRAPDQRVVPGFFNLPAQYDSSGNIIPIRELTLRRFEAMERTLSLDRLSAEQVREMEQWTSIRENATELVRQVVREQALDPDWVDIGQRQHDLEARVASARYRLHPEQQASQPGEALRHVPLLSEGTEARRVYEE
jgi:hypothetical protein